jgi:hypothetical protein
LREADKDKKKVVKHALKKEDVRGGMDSFDTE